MEGTPSCDWPGDAQVIAKSLDDPSRFSHLFERYVVQISRYIARRSERSVVEDLTAETFIVAFRSRDSFDRTKTSALPWLYGIANNVLRHHARSELRLRRLRQKWYSAQDKNSISDDGTSDLDFRIDAGRMDGPISNALAQLDPDWRDALLLFSYAELSYQEIADALEVPVGTVRSRIFRSRARLRELLSPIEAIEG